MVRMKRERIIDDKIIAGTAFVESSRPTSRLLIQSVTYSFSRDLLRLCFLAVLRCFSNFFLLALFEIGLIR